MAEAPAVALLFEDGTLGDQLRSALQERGVRIVHEGSLSDLSRQRLTEVGAEVLVVNLDDEDDDALDRLYEAIDGDRQRVVFNDAQASRKLDGWDRARWARHLAMKVLAIGDVDPPRPADARRIEPAAAAPDPAPAPVDSHAAERREFAAAAEDVSHQQTVAASETLAAELEALLAAGDLPAENEFGAGLNYAAGDKLALEEGRFGVEADSTMQDLGSPSGSPGAEPAHVAAVAHDPLERVSVDEAPHAGNPAELAELAEQIPVAAMAAPARSSDSWSLLEDDAAPIAPVATAADALMRVEAHAFGIEKLSAADYLAPASDGHEDSPIKLGMSLELVSLEEAIAPQHYEPLQADQGQAHEMMLGEPTGALGRLVVLGATTESTHSVCEFLSCLPAGLRLAVLHTQHLAGKPAEALVEHLAAHCALPVRLAQPGQCARVGEVLVVPSDRQVRLMRDGRIELLPVEAGSAQAPSIDASFTMAASVFGRDAVAIVFAGHSTDAVGGCQAIHDRGGQVWVEAAPGEHFADMVGAVMAERLSHYSGTSQQLAAHLVEEFSMEGRR